MSLTRLLWAVAVVLTVVVVGLSYVGRRSDGEPTLTVMVATQLIPAGTVVKPGTFDFVTVPQNEIEPGTVTDATYLAFHPVAHEIFPGERFHVADFSP